VGVAQQREARFGGGGGRADVLPPPAPAHPLRTRARIGRVCSRPCASTAAAVSVAARSRLCDGGKRQECCGGGWGAPRAGEREHEHEQRARRRRRRSCCRCGAFGTTTRDNDDDDVLVKCVCARCRSLAEVSYSGCAADEGQFVVVVIGLDASPGRTTISLFVPLPPLFSTSRPRAYIGRHGAGAGAASANGSSSDGGRKRHDVRGGGDAGRANDRRAAGGRAPESTAAPPRLVALGLAADAHDVPAHQLPLAAVHVAPHQARRHGARVQRRARRGVRGRPARPPVRSR